MQISKKKIQRMLKNKVVTEVMNHKKAELDIWRTFSDRFVEFVQAMPTVHADWLEDGEVQWDDEIVAELVKKTSDLLAEVDLEATLVYDPDIKSTYAPEPGREEYPIALVLPDGKRLLTDYIRGIKGAQRAEVRDRLSSVKMTSDVEDKIKSVRLDASREKQQLKERYEALLSDKDAQVEKWQTGAEIYANQVSDLQQTVQALDADLRRLEEERDRFKDAASNEADATQRQQALQVELNQVQQERQQLQAELSYAQTELQRLRQQLAMQPQGVTVNDDAAIIQEALITQIRQMKTRDMATPARVPETVAVPKEVVRYEDLPIEVMLTKLKSLMTVENLPKYRGITELVNRYTELSGTGLDVYTPTTGYFMTMRDADGDARVFVTDDQQFFELDDIDDNGYDLVHAPDLRRFSAAIHAGTGRLKLNRDLRQDLTLDEPDEIEPKTSLNTHALVGKRILIVSWHEGSRAKMKQKLEADGARVDTIGTKTMSTSRIKSDLQRDYDLKYVFLHGVHHRTFYDAKDLSQTDKRIRIMINPGVSVVEQDAIAQLENR